MKNSLQTQYNLIKEGKGDKSVFTKTAKNQFPDLIRNAAPFEEVVNLLKHRNIISEGAGHVVIGTPAIGENNDIGYWKEIFKNSIQEGRPKGSSKKQDKKSDTPIDSSQALKGFWVETHDEKNQGKTFDEIETIVEKNLKKDPQFYVKSGFFGEKDLGMEEDKPYKEPTGKYKSSGFNKAPIIKESAYSSIKNFKYVEETLDDLYNLILKYVKDPEDAEIELDNYISGGIDGLSDTLASQLMRDKEFQKIKEGVTFKDKAQIGNKKQEKELDDVINNFKKNMKQNFTPKNKKLNESKSKSKINDRIKEIEQKGSIAALEAKINALDEEITEREEKLTMVKENEALAEFVDKTSIKNIEKEIQELQKAKAGYQKLYEKYTAKKPKQQITEPEGEEKVEEGIHDMDITSAPHTNIKDPKGDGWKYNPKQRADSLAKLKNFGPKK